MRLAHPRKKYIRDHQKKFAEPHETNKICAGERSNWRSQNGLHPNLIPVHYISGTEGLFCKN